MSLLPRPRSPRDTRKGSRSASSKGAAPAGTRATPPEDVVLGTLRSELDEPAQLPEAFVKVASRVAELTTRYDRSELTKRQFAHALSLLRIRCGDGSEWALGVRSGRWYRRFVNGEWTATIPPSAEEQALWGDAEVTDGSVFLDAEPFPARAGDPVGWGTGSEAPWPSAGTNASGEHLPSPYTPGVVDEHGVWADTFTTPDHRRGHDPSHGSDESGFDLPDELFK